MKEKNKERAFEVLLLVVGLVGLFVLFTILFAGPRIIFDYILGLFGYAT